MRTTHLFAILTCAAIFWANTFASAADLTIYAEENPPFNMVKDGQAQGAATDLFLAVAQKAGLAIDRAKIQTVPWARGYDAVQKEANTVLFPVARTEAREGLFKWVGPVYKVKIGLIAQKAKGYKIPDAASAAKLKIGTVRDGAPEQAVIAAGVPADTLDRGNDLVSNLKKLQAGRIDLLAFNAVAAAYNMPTLGMNFADYEVVFTLSEPTLFFAVSKETSDETVKSLQSALDSLKADGSYDATIKKFIP
jgi:polar amino acid transport system substrate-binding protein